MSTIPLRIGIIGLGEIGQLHCWIIRGRQPESGDSASQSGNPLLRRGKRVIGRLVGSQGRRLAGYLLRKQEQATSTMPAEGHPPAVTHSAYAEPPIPPGPGIDGVEITAVADTNSELLAWFADAFGIRQTYRDYQELVARTDVDAVLVCTPQSTHPEITIEAARHGKHIFCEKPMALTSADCRRMIDAAKKAGVVLQIGYVLRFSSDRAPIHDAIANKTLGRPVFLQESMNPRAGGPQRWVHDEHLGGGVLWEHSHTLDFFRYVLGEPDHVFAVGGRFKPDDTSALDTLAVSLSFPSGDKALFTDSYALRGFGWDKTGYRPHYINIDVLGPRGVIQFPDTDLSNTLTFCTYGDTSNRVQKIPWRSFWGANGYREELEHFFACIRERKPSRVSGEEGLLTTKLLETVKRSVQTGEVCRFDPQSP